MPISFSSAKSSSTDRRQAASDQARNIQVGKGASAMDGGLVIGAKANLGVSANGSSRILTGSNSLDLSKLKLGKGANLTLNYTGSNPVNDSPVAGQSNTGTSPVAGQAAPTTTTTTTDPATNTPTETPAPPEDHKKRNTIIAVVVLIVLGIIFGVWKPKL